MLNEIGFYQYFGSDDFDRSLLPFPKMLEARIKPGDTHLKLERIEGLTVDEYLAKTNSLQIAISAFEKAYEKFWANVDETKIVKCNDDILHEYVKTTYERVESVSSFMLHNSLKETDELIINNKNVKVTDFDVLMHNITSYMNAHEFLWGPIHGDPNTANMIYNEADDKLTFIDPRGYFGNSKIYGDINYDFAKFMYGLHGYTSFNNDHYFTIEMPSTYGVIIPGHAMHPGTVKVTDSPVIKFDMRSYGYPLEVIYEYASILPGIESFEHMKLLIGIIYMKLSAYIKNNVPKMIASYYYGNALCTGALESLRNKDINYL
jgi:hypothetical protein